MRPPSPMNLSLPLLAECCYEFFSKVPSPALKILESKFVGTGASVAGGPSFFCEWIGWEGAGESESKRNATGVAELL